MATLGNIAYAPPQTTRAFKCPPGLWINKISGVTNPNGALGLEIVCSDNKPTFGRLGATGGNPYSFDSPVGIYATGGSTGSGYVSSIGPNQTTQFGPKGPKIMTNMQ